MSDAPGKRGRVWRHVSYTDQPTASFQLVADPSQRLSGVIGSNLLSGLTLLSPRKGMEA